MSSVILIFDATALLQNGTREWQEFSKVGICYLPEVVIEEIRFLCKRATAVEEEAKAREFSRFFDSSGWKTTAIYHQHPLLQAQEGEQLSKNARLHQAIAQSVYALSQENQEHLVVFIVNNQRLREQVESLQIPNLSTLTTTALLQWARTNQRPINIAQKSHLIKEIEPLSGGATNVDSKTPIQNPISSAQRKPSTRKKSSSFFPSLISLLLSLVSFGAVGLAIWFLVNPASFQEFWNKTGLPSLPSQN